MFISFVYVELIFVYLLDRGACVYVYVCVCACVCICPAQGDPANFNYVHVKDYCFKFYTFSAQSHILLNLLSIG